MIKCPKCGSEQILMNASDDVYAKDFKLYTCQKCYHRFNDEEERNDQDGHTAT